MATHLERMIALADEVFDARQDPDQLQVDDQVLARLEAIHPSCVSEYVDGDGPVAWILMLPTTGSLMQKFLLGELSENQLYLTTPVTGPYDALYLCSALVLPEYRRQGIARRLAMEAAGRLIADHPIRDLFVWTFSEEGAAASRALADAFRLPLHFRTV